METVESWNVLADAPAWISDDLLTALTPAHVDYASDDCFLWHFKHRQPIAGDSDLLCDPVRLHIPQLILVLERSEQLLEQCQIMRDCLPPL
jgi:hypothetical protein